MNMHMHSHSVPSPPSFPSSMTDKQATVEANVAAMSGLEGYDVVIVCCSGEKQADYWQARLSAVRGQVLPASCKVLAVFEDWGGDGAGNGLGTLYAYQKAVIKAKSLYDGYELHTELVAKRASAALYHTAGKGTRLAPLPGAENNNKPGVKLPATLSVGGHDVPMTILEAVLKQTGVYAPMRKGRLSVFWGDQVFVPTVPVAAYTPVHHADILCSLGPMPSAEEWEAKGLDKYGLIAVNSNEEAAQVEKVTHATAKTLLGSFGAVTKVGVSLGSFSLSASILVALLEEFKTELVEKTAKLDTDPGLWMALTLSKEAYIQLLEAKKTPASESGPHFDRMQAMLARFRAAGKGGEESGMGLFGAVDIGQGAYWWDYGQLKLYFMNNISVTHTDDESRLYREFLGVPVGRRARAEVGEGVGVDEESVLSAVQVKGGTIAKSVLTNVSAIAVEAQGAVLVNVTARKVVAGRGAVLYNVVDDSEEGLVLGEKEVLVGVFDEAGKQQQMASHAERDGGVWWKKEIRPGQPTFEQIYLANREVDVALIEAKSQAAHAKLRESLFAEV